MPTFAETEMVLLVARRATAALLTRLRTSLQVSRTHRHLTPSVGRMLWRGRRGHHHQPDRTGGDLGDDRGCLRRLASLLAGVIHVAYTVIQLIKDVRDAGTVAGGCRVGRQQPHTRHAARDLSRRNRSSDRQRTSVSAQTSEVDPPTTLPRAPPMAADASSLRWSGEQPPAAFARSRRGKRGSDG